MKSTDIIKSLKIIKKKIDRLDRKMEQLLQDANPRSKRKLYSYRLIGAYRDPEFRNYIISLRKRGMSFDHMARHIREKWPHDASKHKTRSSLHRFIASARIGKLKEFGVDFFDTNDSE